MRRLLALWNCVWATADYSLHAGREAQQMFAAHGVRSTLFSCEVCGKFHLRGRS